MIEPIDEGFVFIAGPYGSSGGHDAVTHNITRARDVGAILAENDIPYFCPHMNTAYMEEYVDVPGDFWHRLDFTFLCYAEAVVLVDGWEASPGTLAEIEKCRDWGIPVFEPHQLEEFLGWWAERIKELQEQADDYEADHKSSRLKELV
jgi:hypothetical protein